MVRPTPFVDRYVWDPAADDRDLAHACVELKGGRFSSTGAVLDGTRRDFALRAHRSLVLASAAADSDVAEQWASESPGPDAALLVARSSMIRALRSADLGDGHASALAELARGACTRAAELFPQDPTPWVSLLALAHIDGGVDAPPEELPDAPGPWRLFAQAQHLDPLNREAHHRLLAYFFARHGGSHEAMWQVAWYLAERVPLDSELSLLTFVALAEHHRDRRDQPMSAGIWAEQQWRRAAYDVFHRWFPRVESEYRFTPVVDLGYLAHALEMGRQQEARTVLESMGPFAAAMPWRLHGEPQHVLSTVRRGLGLPVPVS